MPRKLRIEYPGAIYHVINRGDRREDIFRDDADRTRFLETLGEACRKTGVARVTSTPTMRQVRPASGYAVCCDSVA